MGHPTALTNWPAKIIDWVYTVFGDVRTKIRLLSIALAHVIQNRGWSLSDGVAVVAR